MQKKNIALNRVYIQDITPEIAKAMKLKVAKGVIVSKVQKDSPAEKAGMKLGDIITQIGNTPIEIDKNVTEAIFEEDLRVGDHLNFLVWRDGKKLNLNFLLESIKDN